jgi:hypothetical protein
MSNRIQTILLEDDIIEIFYNANLTKKPYLIRLSNYESMVYEIRADNSDLEELSTVLSLITNKSSSCDIDNADTAW